MDQIKALIQELHRRSVWQVLIVFLGASWLVIEVVDVFVDRGLVPEWTFTASVVLLLLGLPVVLATAFVQEGPPTRDAPSNGAGSAPPGRDEADSGVTEGEAAPPKGSGVPSPALDAHPGPDTRRLAELLTWNRALLGGVLAFALLGVVTTVYLTMRVLGVGAPGTLVAQGVLDEGEVIVLADFVSDVPAVPGQLVTETLRLSLERSPTIRPMPPVELSDVLTRMERNPGQPLDADLAREVAVRGGLKAMLTGDVAQVGGRIVLTARLVDVSTGRVLAPFQETAADTARLVGAIDELGKAIRDKAGEPLASINAEPPLRQVTTGSLEALRLYSQAFEVERRGDGIRAADLYREATRIDPDFAMAHRKLGVQLGNNFGSRTEQIAAYTRAYELRDRLPPVERFVTDATYYHLVQGDLDAAARAYETVLEMDPTNDVALNNLGIVYSRSGKYAEAERVYRLAIADEANNSNYQNLVSALFLQDKREEVWETLREWKDTFPESDAAWMFPGWVRFAEGDYATADSLFTVLTDRFPRNPIARFYGNAGHWIIGLMTGRLAEGDRYGREFVRSSEAVGLDRWALNGEAMRAISFATYRQDTAQALAHLREAMETYPLAGMEPLDRSYLFMVRALLDLGLTDEAEALYEEFLTEVPEQYWGDLEQEDPREVEALLRAARGDVEGAIDELRPLTRDCNSLCRLRVRYSLARLYEAQGDVAGAARALEEYVTRTEVDRLREDGYRYPPALLRLGELHEQLGNVRDAASWYERFAELWKDADPEFQATVEAARAKAARLRASIS